MQNQTIGIAPKHKRVGTRLSSNVPVASSSATAKEVLNLLLQKSKDFETINYVYIIDAEKHLVGIVSIQELMAAEGDMPVSSFMQKNIISVSENSHQETSAMLAIKHNIKAIPVISREKKFLGIVSPDAILSILHEEHVEDALRSGGFSGADTLAKDMIISPGKIYFRKRIPWLILGLIGSIAMATVVGSFDKIIKELLILAAFVPAIVYIADAVGTQTQTIFIRSLAIDPKFNLRRYIVREIAVSTALALILGLLMGLIGYIWWKPAIFGVILGISFFATILAASIIAVLLPWLFMRMKIDPAIAAGPFATIIRDLASVFIYFSIATIILSL